MIFTEEQVFVFNKFHHTLISSKKNEVMFLGFTHKRFHTHQLDTACQPTSTYIHKSEPEVAIGRSKGANMASTGIGKMLATWKMGKGINITTTFPKTQGFSPEHQHVPFDNNLYTGNDTKAGKIYSTQLKPQSTLDSWLKSTRGGEVEPSSPKYHSMSNVLDALDTGNSSQVPISAQ